MNLSSFYSQNGRHVQISAQQASRFAKEIANDFNPIHNPDAKRFCVPGDLLFSLVLANYGLSPRMSFVFTGMVGDSVSVDFSPTEAGLIELVAANKVCLRVEREGDPVHHAALINQFSERYVAFSGQNFPHLLQPLLEAKQVMLNPDRPTVIYERMGFEIDLSHAEQLDPTLELAGAELTLNGKRGEVNLAFSIHSEGQQIGKGFKRLLVSGLIPYAADVANGLMAAYLSWQTAYKPEKTR